jgi:hypothetical protein
LLWENGILTDLNTLIPADSPWFLQEAFSINERGQIVGHMFNSPIGETHGFLATPVESNEDTAGAAQSITSRPPVVLPENVRQMLQRRMNRYHFSGRTLGPRN